MPKETVEQQAARVGELLRSEFHPKRGYILFAFEPGNRSGAITFTTNVPNREHIIEFLHEWIERNKPARG